VEIAFYDVAGRLLKSTRQQYESGMHSISVDKEALGSSGVIYYQLMYKDKQLRKRMVVLE